MKKTVISSSLFLAGLALTGCVIKTSESSDPESPNSPQAAAPQPAAPIPSPGSPAAAPAPAAPNPSPTPTPAAAPPAPAPGALSPPARAPAPAAAPPAPAPGALSPPARAPAPAIAAPARPPQPKFSPPPKPKQKPVEHKATLASGAPPHLHSGASLSYWIWRDGDGLSWHIRTTTTGMDLRRFSGRVWMDGKVIELKPVVLETQDRIKKEGEETFVFDFSTEGAMDGLDFKVTAGKCVTFHLLLDGKPTPPSEINIGPNETHPGSATFQLCN